MSTTILTELLDGGSAARYGYDALGQRIQKTLGSTVTQYVHDQSGRVTLETDASLNPIVDYIFAGGILVAEYQNNTTYFAQTDHLGSTRLLSGMDTGGIQDWDYLPYGEVLVGVPVTSHKFTSLERDSETNLDHTLFRKYSSQFGRWMTPDPAGLMAVSLDNPQSLNRYSYVLNDPLDFVDPLGLFCITRNGELLCVVGVTAGGGGGNGVSPVCTVDRASAPCGFAYQLLLSGNGYPAQYAGGDCAPARSGKIYCGPEGETLFDPASYLSSIDPNWRITLNAPTSNYNGGGTYDQRARDLARALNNTGVQSLGNPCTVGLWYAASAGGAVFVSSTQVGGALFPWTKDAIDVLKVWYSLASPEVQRAVRTAASALAFATVKTAQGCSSFQ